MIEQIESGILTFFQNIHNPVLDRVMVTVTTLGNDGAIWILIGVLLLLQKKYRKYGFMLLTALLLGLMIGNGILKNVIARPRPCWRNPEIELLIHVPSDYSFPSGHTLAAFESITVLYFANKKYFVAALILGSLIAISRMYLYVHYPTDILGGVLLGVAIGGISVWMYRCLGKERNFNGTV